LFRFCASGSWRREETGALDYKGQEWVQKLVRAADLAVSKTDKGCWLR